MRRSNTEVAPPADLCFRLRSEENVTRSSLLPAARPPGAGRPRSPISLACLVGLLTLAVSGHAAAQSAADAVAEEDRDPTSYTEEELYAEDIEERVVLAGESEAAAAFDSGDSVTGFNAADLEAAGAFDIADIAKFTPNLEIVTAGSTSPTFFIRGVGLNDFNPNSSGAVAIYQDDVPINSPAIQLGLLFDVEQVNVSRGPQGTGPARNASAGAINVFSRRPSGGYGATFKGSYGNYNAIDFEGAFEAPIVEDVLSTRWAFRLVERDGFAENRCGNAPAFEDRPVLDTGGNAGSVEPPYSICGERVRPEGVFLIGQPEPTTGISSVPPGLPKNVNDQDNWAARGTFLFEPTLDTEFLFSGHFGRRDELSRLGQALGTRGRFCPDDGSVTDLVACSRTPTLQNGATINGIGGGPAVLTDGSAQDFRTFGDSSDYYEPDVRRTFVDNQRRNVDRLLSEFCAAGCTPLEEADLIALGSNQARIQTGQQVGENLDRRPYRGDYNRVGKTTNTTWGGVVKGDIALDYGLNLNFVFGADGYDRKQDVDLDFTPNTLFQIITKDQGIQFTPSVALTGRIPTPAPIDWEIGGFFLYEKLDVEVDNDLGDFAPLAVSARDYTQETMTVAGYFEFEWDFWEDFTLDGGARFNYDRKQMDYELVQGTGPGAIVVPQNDDKAWDHTTGTIRLTYRFAEGIHALWKYTHGWKGGHYNATATLQNNMPLTVAGPEEIDAFEFGLRGAWFDGRVGLNASLFYYDYNDYQIFTTQQSIAGLDFVVLNANDARVFGAEIETQLRPWVGALVQTRFGWLESKFLDFVQIQQSRQQVGTTSEVITIEVDNSGNRLLNSPRFKVSISAEQEVQLGGWGAISARYDGAWQDDTYFDATEGRGVPSGNPQRETLPENTIGQESYWLHNASIAYRTPDGAIELRGWVRNLTDKAYKTFAADLSAFQQTTIYFVGNPRTYGATLQISFF